MLDTPRLVAKRIRFALTRYETSPLVYDRSATLFSALH
jgi:hypothetical protein